MTKISPIQIFTFGYYGWGNSTPQLVEAVDAVERSRGFKPPIFVDIRIRRAVRAPGFNGPAFEKLLGNKRHRWMKKLGNHKILKKTGPMFPEPNAVNDLLDHAIKAAEEQRRLIFFCGCEWPRWCHRSKVVSLGLKAAKRRGLRVEFVEWPGGEPSHLDLSIDSKNFNAMLRSRWNIPATKMSLGKSAGISWGSTATINCDDQRVQAVIGPAQFRLAKWRFPVFAQGYTQIETRNEAAKMRKEHGLEAKRI